LLSLPDVTICSIDCVTPGLSAEAINISSQKIDFGDAILFSDKTLKGKFSSVEIPVIRSKNEYSQFVIQQLIKHIHTNFVLIVQWDGYVTNPGAWTNEFLGYDYIGARWPWHKDGFTVGNGGFSLRSIKLMKEVLNLQIDKNSQVNEDELICRQLRPQLETCGIRFATDKIADMFSYERTTPELEAFGFHGLFNMWRHCDDSELIKRLECLNHSTYLSVEYLELMLQYLQQKKFRVYKELYNLLSLQLDEAMLVKHLNSYIKEAALIELIVATAK
jgi:hypothetical protein